MKNYIKSKLFVFFLLSISGIFLIFPPLMASSTATAIEHKKIMTQHIADLRALQNQIFSLFENIAGVSTKDNTNLNSEIDLIYSNIGDVEKRILNYVKGVPKLSSQRRDILLALVAQNSVENSLYQLTQFIKETSPVQKTLLLEDFYFLRTSATETLNRLENIISRE